ncbi:MAG TPA: hypothetical protein VL171_16710 [Verrucomicrobiae bacterium]|nr:hypothetical protein [Verrucomicrobiae bacterium]
MSSGSSEIAKVIGKLSGALLAVTLALYFLLNIIPTFAKEVIDSNLKCREFMVASLILLMFMITVIWAYAIRVFSKNEVQPQRLPLPNPNPASEDRRALHDRVENEVKKMSEL